MSSPQYICNNWTSINRSGALELYIFSRIKFSSFVLLHNEFLFRRLKDSLQRLKDELAAERQRFSASLSSTTSSRGGQAAPPTAAGDQAQQGSSPESPSATNHAHLQILNAQLLADNTRLHSDNTRLHSDNTRFHADNSRLHADNTRLVSDNTRLQARVAELEAGLKTLQDTFAKENQRRTGLASR